MSAAPRYLVTGANGFVGQYLCAEIVKRGGAVTRALRSLGSAEGGGKSVVVGEVNELTEWGAALHDVDVVIHLAARVHVVRDNLQTPLGEYRRINVAGTEHLARAAAAVGVKRFVYVSSIKVNGEGALGSEESGIYSEADTPKPCDPYGVSKWEAEQALHRIAKETGLEVVIVRPPLVYGPGVKGNFAQMLKVIESGIPLPLASIKNSRSLIYVGNLADALIRCATHPAAAGQTYLIRDGEDISTPDLLRQLGDAMGHPARLFCCPLVVLKLLGWVLRRTPQIERLIGSLRIDNDRISNELSWCPPYSLREGLRITSAAFQCGVMKNER